MSRDRDISSRPLRRVFGWFLRAFIIASLVLGAVVLRYAYAKPHRTGVYSRAYAERFGETQNCVLNGRLIVKQCRDRFVELVSSMPEPDAIELVDVTFIYNGVTEDRLGSTEERRALACRAFAKVKEAGLLRELDRLVNADCYHWDTPSEAFSTDTISDLAELGPCRLAARLSRARMFEAARAGDWDEFQRGFEVAHAIGRLMSLRGSAIETLVGGASRMMVNAELVHTLVEREVPASILDRCAQVIDACGSSIDVTRALAGERLMALDFLDSVHDRGGTLVHSELNNLRSEMKGDSRDDSFGNRLFNFIGPAHARKASSEAVVNQLMDDVTSAMSRPPHARPFTVASVQDRGDALPQKFAATRTSLSAFSAFSASVDAMNTRLAATRLILAIHCHKRAHGEFAASLEHIDVAQTLDPMTGKPFVYRPRVPSETDPRAFILYSVGRDGQDDGGRSPDGDSNRAAVLTKDTMTGYDAIMNPLRGE